MISVINVPKEPIFQFNVPIFQFSVQMWQRRANFFNLAKLRAKRCANFSTSPAKMCANFLTIFKRIFQSLSFSIMLNIFKFQEYLGNSKKIISRNKEFLNIDKNFLTKTKNFLHWQNFIKSKINFFVVEVLEFLRKFLSCCSKNIIFSFYGTIKDLNFSINSLGHFQRSRCDLTE